VIEMSQPTRKVARMAQEYVRQVAIVMAALELLPAQPSDLTGILRDPDQFRALIDPCAQSYESELVGYLRANLDQARIEHWHKQIDRLVTNEVAFPILATNLPGAPTYPTRLAECWDAPPLLFSSAPLDESRERASIAIIGSRAASDEILMQTRRLAADLAASATIVSGLALGVDAAAHRGALDIGGRTVAVLGTGITRIYPEQNIDLARQIRETGAIVSQFAPFAPRTRTSFLRRNAVIAGLNDISIIMTGEYRSGSRNEIRHAMDYGRTVLMWAPGLERQQWAQKLADSGEAAFITDADEVRLAIKEIDR
jgi:DNA processing protein